MLTHTQPFTKSAVVSTFLVAGVASRFEADDSLSILKLHRVALHMTNSKPVKSSLQNDCTVLVVELDTK